MKNPTAIIADDEIHLAKYLQERLAHLWPELEIIGLAKNGLEVMQMVAHTHPMVAFLDIRMPGLNGLEVATLLQGRVHTVFVTAFDQYAVEAFDRQSVDYLLKPVTDERLSRTILRLREKLIKAEMPGDLIGILRLLALPQTAPKDPCLRWIRAMAGETVRQVPVTEVIYLQARDKYVSVYTRDGESLIRTSLSDLLAQLNPDDFWQVYRSIIVNVHRIVSIQRDTMSHMQLTLKDCDVKVPVSRAFEHLFKHM